MQVLSGSQSHGIQLRRTARCNVNGLPGSRHIAGANQRTELRARNSRVRLAQPVTALFNFFKKKSPVSVAAPVRPTIVPTPSYNIPAVLLGVTAVSAVSGNYIAGGISAILGGFLAFQASRVKFIFGSDALEVRIGEQEEEFDNVFVGGPNTWAYDSFVNWEFWWPGFPVLVYFKETQTKPEGQIHFFPVLFDGKQVYDVMKERCGNSQTSLPKEG